MNLRIKSDFAIPAMKRTRNIVAMMILCVICAPAIRVYGTGNIYSSDQSAETLVQKREGYQERLRVLEVYRREQAAKYAGADQDQRAIILRQVRKRLETALLRDVFPAWYGTDWAFSGTSTKPGEGKIACGYFVSTCLRHIGFKVNRIRLAQQPSQRIIETFMDRKQRKIIAGGKSMKVIKGYLKENGDGIYIVGLDSHVGFVSAYGDDVAFIHSSYYEPGSFVKSEKIDTKNPLSDSQYRVFGKILSDAMIVGWLTGREYPVKTR